MPISKFPSCLRFPVRERRSIALLVLGLSAVLITGEWIARNRLGTQPLYVADRHTEYRLKSNQKLTRFGNRIEVHAFSERSASLAATPPSSARRVLVFGDSVVWGGAVLDQALIATSMLDLPISRC
jgi:hypothetical protein